FAFGLPSKTGCDIPSICLSRRPPPRAPIKLAAAVFPQCPPASQLPRRTPWWRIGYYGEHSHALRQNGWHVLDHYFFPFVPHGHQGHRAIAVLFSRCYGMHLHPAIFCFIFFGTPDPTLHPRQIYLLKVGLAEISVVISDMDTELKWDKD
ncbi:hypothetical protein ACJX0J_037688, partial [Zea mays]